MQLEVSIDDLIPLRRLLLDLRDRLRGTPAHGTDWGDHLVRPDILLLEKQVKRINRLIAQVQGLTKDQRRHMEEVFC